MGRELAGVIACMQEIEIACGRLIKNEKLEGFKLLQEIQGIVRGFFLEPSAERAAQLASRLDEIKKDLGAGENIMTAQIEVDRIKTSLANLQDELKEVLEDLHG